jgi:hypothetical protein
MMSLVEKRELAYYKVWYFWNTYGNRLQSDAFKDYFVDKMRQMYQDIEDRKGNTIIHKGILGILEEQRKHIIQFDTCIDEFNDYLGALRLLDLMFRG